jgi:hypothetical protein
MAQRGTIDNTADGDVRRAAERMTLACRALSAAANDLRVAYVRSGTSAVDDAVEQVRSETERVCELAEEVVKLAKNLAAVPMAAAGPGV